jgi:hypothetical protein
MDWLKQIGGVLERYEGARPDSPPPDVERHFDTYSRVAPQATLSDGLAAAFRSDRTPPFARMVSELFGRAPRTERAGVLQHLLATLGPAILARKGINLSPGGAAPNPERTAAAAEQLSPRDVEELAAEAEKKDPTIIDRISDAYARNPQLVKTLGAAALTIALSHAAKRQRAFR